MLDRRTVIAGFGALGLAHLVAGPLGAIEPQVPDEELRFEPPPGACDCHVHIIDPERFPVEGGRPRQPATVSDLLSIHRRLHVSRVVLVNSTAYGADNRCLLDALKQLGPRGRGIAGLAVEVNDRTLHDLNAAGVRGVRLPIGDDQPRQGPHAEATVKEGRSKLEGFAGRLSGTGWNINTRLPVLALPEYEATLAKAAVPIVIDHFAVARVSLGGVRQPGFDVLLRLLRSGNIYLKLSEVDAVSASPDMVDVKPLIDAVVTANPDRILWGTDWQGAGRVNDTHLFNQLATWLPDASMRERILVQNPARLYGF